MDHFYISQYRHINIEKVNVNQFGNEQFCVFEPAHYLHLGPLDYKKGHFIIDDETDELFGYWLEHMRRQLYKTLCTIRHLVHQPIHIDYENNLKIEDCDLKDGMYNILLCFDKLLYKNNVYSILYSTTSISKL